MSYYSCIDGQFLPHESAMDDRYNTEFYPKQFYWLFNPEVKFNERENFKLEKDLTVEDYMVMRNINRKKLTCFLKNASKAVEKLILDNFGKITINTEGQ
jgi:hypothetical protein